MLYALAKDQRLTPHELFLGQSDVPGDDIETSHIIFDLQCLMAWNRVQRQLEKE